MGWGLVCYTSVTLLIPIGLLGSGGAEEGLEAVVHMLLNVAVKEGEAELIGGEVDGGSTVVGNDHGVLNDAGGFFTIDLGEFPEVAVQMHVDGHRRFGIAENEAIACSLLQGQTPPRGDKVCR